MIRVLFVCMGNICRSPAAQGVFEHVAREAGWEDRVFVDSAGTHAYHVGEPPDERAQREARRRGLDLSRQRARAVSEEDFSRFDYILAMDESNLSILRDRRPGNANARLHLLLEFGDGIEERSVPDPYWSGQDGFARVFDLVENGASGFLSHLMNTHDHS